MADLSLSLGLDAGGFVAGVRNAEQTALKSTKALERAYASSIKSVNGLTAATIEQRAQRLRDLGVAEQEIAKFAQSANAMRAYRQEAKRVADTYQNNTYGLNRHLDAFGRHHGLMSRTAILMQQQTAIQARMAAEADKAAAKAEAAAERKAAAEERAALRIMRAQSAQMRQQTQTIAPSLPSSTAPSIQPVSLSQWGAMGGAQILQTAAVYAGTQQIIQMADAWTGLNNRLKLVTESEKELVEVRTRLMNIANSTGQGIDSTAQLYQRLSAAQKELGMNSGELLDIVDTVNKAMVIGGGAAASNEAALVQFSQAMASGVLRGEELNSVLEQAPALAQTIAKGMGVGVGQLRGMAKDGQLTAEKVVNAIRTMRGSVDADFAKINMSISQSAQVFRNKLTEFIGGNMEASGAAKLLSGSLLLLANNLDLVAGAVMLVGGLKLASWTLASAVAFSAQAHATLAAAAGNKSYAVSAEMAGAASTRAAARNLTLSQSFKAIQVSAIGAGTSLKTLSAQYAIGPMSAYFAAAIGGALGLEAALKAAFGKDASNAASDFFDNVLHELGVIDKEVETLGTKIYDLFHNQEGRFQINFDVEGLAAKLNPIYGLMHDVKQFFGKENAPARARQVQNPEAVSLASRFTGTASITDLTQHAQNGLKDTALKDLNSQIVETTLKFKEQAASVGMSNEELQIMRLEAAKNAAIEAQKAELAKEGNLTERQRQQILAETTRQYTAEVDAAKAALNQFKNEAQALSLQKEISSTREQLEHQAEALGKSGNELILWEMQMKSLRALNLIADEEKRQQAANAAAADLNKARQAAKLIEQYQRQQAVMETLKDLQYELETAGMDADQKRLYDLAGKGATPEQLRQAREMMEQAKLVRDSAEKQRETARRMQESAAQEQRSSERLALSAERFESAASRLAAGQIDAAGARAKQEEEEKPKNEILFISGRRRQPEVQPAQTYTLNLQNDNHKVSGQFITKENLPAALEGFLQDRARAYRN